MTLLIISSAYVVFGSTFILYFHRKGKLSGDKQKQTCGYLYEDLNYEKEGWGALCYPMLCNLRLIMLVYVTLYLQDYMVIQVSLMSLSTIYMMHILTSKQPYLDLRTNYGSQGLAGEVVILVVNDLFLFATDPQVIPDNREAIGFVIIAVVGLNITITAGGITIGSICETIAQIKSYFARRAFNSGMEARKVKPPSEPTNLVEAKYKVSPRD